MVKNFGDLSDIAKALEKRNDSDYQRGDVWQSILNVGYDRWGAAKGASEKWRYDDMVKWVELEYGKFAALCVLLGKYNNQVCNGGHMQYWDNGYSGGKGGGCFMDEVEEAPLHDQMVKWFEDFGLHKSKIGKKVHGIIKSFEIVEEVEDHEYDEDGYLESYGETRLLVSNSGDLDSRYYAIDDAWMEYFSKVVVDAIASARDQLQAS